MLKEFIALRKELEQLILEQRAFRAMLKNEFKELLEK
jgi:hypothetical protein